MEWIGTSAQKKKFSWCVQRVFWQGFSHPFLFLRKKKNCVAISFEKFHILFHRTLLSLRTQHISSKKFKLTNHATGSLLLCFDLLPMHDQHRVTEAITGMVWPIYPCPYLVIWYISHLGRVSLVFWGTPPPPGCQTHAEEQVCSQPPPSTFYECLSASTCQPPRQLRCWSPWHSLATQASALSWKSFFDGL